MTRLATPLLVVACVALAAPVDVALAGDGPDVQLLSRGKGRKRLLRYSPVDGHVETIAMTLDMSVKTGMLGTEIDLDMPKMLITMETTTRRVAEGIELSFVYADVAMEGDPSDPMVAEVGRTLESTLLGLEGRSVLTDRGDMVSVDVEMPEGLDLAAGGNTGDFVNPEQWSVPLPEKKVGVGARWVVTQIEDPGMGVELEQVSTWTVLDLPKDGPVQLAVEIVQNVETGPVTSGPMAELGGRIERWDGGGTARWTLDPRYVVPRDLLSDVRVSGVFGTPMGDVATDMTMALTMKPAAE